MPVGKEASLGTQSRCNMRSFVGSVCLPVNCNSGRVGSGYETPRLYPPPPHEVCPRCCESSEVLGNESRIRKQKRKPSKRFLGVVYQVLHAGRIDARQSRKLEESEATLSTNKGVDIIIFQKWSSYRRETLTVDKYSGSWEILTVIGADDGKKFERVKKVTITNVVKKRRDKQPVRAPKNSFKPF